MKILVFGPRDRYDVYRPPFADEMPVELVFRRPDQTYVQAAQENADARIIFVDAITDVGPDVMDQLPELKMIHSEGVGYNCIDCQAARDPSSAGIANEAFRRLWHLLRKLPLYELLLRREDAPSCFTSDEDCREMWDEMMTRGTQAHDDYAHWIARLSRIGQDLSDFRRNTQWMLSAYFEGLPSCKRENYIDAYGRFKDGIGKAKLVDMDEESDPFYDPPVASFRFDFPAHISFIPYRDEKTGKPKMAERSTFDDLIAFFYLDLTRGIAAGNLPRRCKNCGHWFVAVGGYNTQYCDRPILGQHGKTCRSVGAHETAKRKLREAAAKEYARTYNRLKGRKQRGTISTDEWNCIVAVAEELRAAFQAGEMAESEYCRKLKAL